MRWIVATIVGVLMANTCTDWAPHLSSDGRGYLWFKSGHAAYRDSYYSPSFNSTQDSLILYFEVEPESFAEGETVLTSIEMRFAVKDAVPGVRMEQEEKMVHVSCKDGKGNQTWANKVNGNMLLWRFDSGIVAGQFEYSCSSASSQFKISHGILDVKVPNLP